MAKVLGNLRETLERFNNRKSYQELDAQALDISRKAAAGDWGESEYADWALISNDPIVMANIVKTFITVLVAKLSTSPFRPDDDKLTEVGISLKLNSLFTKLYQDVLQDGYAYVSIGIENGQPVVVPVDARSVVFIGDEATLADAQDVVVFEILGMTLEESRELKIGRVNVDSFIKYNHESERVIVKHYSKRDNRVFLDIYENGEEDLRKENHYELEGLTRIPVVRFVGDEVELSDQRAHYRGLYHLTAGVLKAMVLAATKVNIQAAAYDDDNYLVQHDAIKNHMDVWRNTGIKTFDANDANGQPVQPPIPIVHDPQFLLSAFVTWQQVISSMLGPVVQSSSEAITREEVLARNEVRDAITNAYLTKMVDSIAQVYMCVAQITSMQQVPEPKIIGGFIDTVKRNAQKQELMQIYSLAKESGLNTQGFVNEFVMLGDVPIDVKQRLAQTFQQDPYKSPLTQQLQTQLQQLQQAMQLKDQQMAILKTQASQRLERQAEYTAMVERTKRMDLAFKQWRQEAQDAQAGRLELMKKLLEMGDLNGALKALEAMEARDSLLLTQKLVDHAINVGDNFYEHMVQENKETQTPLPNDMPIPENVPIPQNVSIQKQWG